MASRTAAKIQWHISVKTLILDNTIIFFSIILGFFQFNSCLACYIPFRLGGVMVRQPPPFSFPFGTEPLTSRSHPAFLFPSRRCPRLSPSIGRERGLPFSASPSPSLFPPLCCFRRFVTSPSRIAGRVVSLGLWVILSYLGVFVLFWSFFVCSIACSKIKEKVTLLSSLTGCLAHLPTLSIPYTTGSLWTPPRSCAISAPNVLPSVMYLIY